jgi:uncharacterized damage-inducible protein DinB
MRNANLVDDLVEAWRINHRVTLKVLDGLSPDAFAATLSTRGGRDIGRQLAHVHAVRCAWLRKPDISNGITTFSKDERIARSTLRKALEESADAVERLIRRACADGGSVGGFKRSVVALVGYLIAHESHHRGSILLTAKQSGFPLSEDLKWGIWAWDKI